MSEQVEQYRNIKDLAEEDYWGVFRQRIKDIIIVKNGVLIKLMSDKSVFIHTEGEYNKGMFLKVIDTKDITEILKVIK
ncbi:MAG: hypothetical protein KKH98_04325 [Spirochaetes bacterium]|nr:hypothetical protein [Spirochaetota bacterium]